ncbi:glycosyltransferase family 39 protein [Patescibacteria group bacterium]|nr:glycosyltransferase family 39 protein [Patescibacteria group bacterium]
MINRKSIWILLIGIIVIAAVLRLWQLGNVPPSPDWDEVALGYNAFSIIHTGRDEFGKFLPVVLRSFDDYKPALYAYLAIPSIFIFGLSVFAVRLPSVIFGIVSVIAVFYLVLEIFEDFKYKDQLSIIASFLLSISPWSIQFSRVGFEASVGTALNILAALFFLKGLKKPWFLYIFAIFAAAGIYAYQSEKVFTPLLVLALALIYRKRLFSINKKVTLSVVVLGMILVMPMILYILNNRSALLRVTGTSVFSHQTELLKTNMQKLEIDKTNNDVLGLILDNRRFTYAKAIASGYITHFDINWLFLEGGIARHHAPNMGLLYLFELPFLLIGVYKLIFDKFDIKAKILIFSWFLLAPVPASITSEVPHTVRTLNFLPTYQIFSAIGILSAFIFLSRYRSLKYVFYLSFALIFSVNFIYYLNQYFVQQNYYTSADWQYGYKQAVGEVKTLQNNYKEIVISDNQPMDKSYMFFLFYLQYPPREYQEIAKNSSGGYAVHHYFGRYTFRPIDWQKDSQRRGVLYVGTPGEVPSGVSIIRTIYNLDGSPAMRIVGT